MLLDHVSEVGNVLISLGEQVRQTLVLLVVNHLTIALLILSLGGGGGGEKKNCNKIIIYNFMIKEKKLM